MPTDWRRHGGQRRSAGKDPSKWYIAPISQNPRKWARRARQVTSKKVQIPENDPPASGGVTSSFGRLRAPDPRKRPHCPLADPSRARRPANRAPSEPKMAIFDGCYVKIPENGGSGPPPKKAEIWSSPDISHIYHFRGSLLEVFGLGCGVELKIRRSRSEIVRDRSNPTWP